MTPSPCVQFFVGLPDAASRRALLEKPRKYMQNQLRRRDRRRQQQQQRADGGAWGGVAAHLQPPPPPAAADADAPPEEDAPLEGPARDEVLPQLVAATTGFSGFGCTRLIRLAMERHYSADHEGGEHPLLASARGWQPLVDSTADDLGFSFGGERLGALVISAGPAPPNDARLFRALCRSTGRVMVRLHDPPGTRGWYIQTRSDTALDVVFVGDAGLDSHAVLRTLARFACATAREGGGGGIESVVAVTGVALEKAGAHEEAAVVSHVRGVLDTAREYSSSLVALDVAAAADVQVRGGKRFEDVGEGW